MTQFQRVIKYISMTFAVLLAIGIISAITGLVLHVIAAITGEPVIGNRNRIDVVYDFTGVESLDIDSSISKLEIKVGDSFRVEGYQVPESFRAELKEDGTLLVLDHKKRSFLNINLNLFGYPDAKITVYLPENFIAEEARLDTGVENTTIEALRADKLILSAGIGNVTGKRIAAKKAELDGGIGTITLTEIDLEDAEIDCGIGGVTLEGELKGRNKIDCGIGNVTLTLVGSREDYDLDLDAGIGTVRVDGKKTSNSYHSREAKHFLKVDGGIGKVSINFLD